MEKIDLLLQATEETRDLQKARKQLGWSRRELKRVVKEYQFHAETYLKTRAAEVGGSAEMLAKTLNQYLEKALPTELHAMHLLAKEYARKDDLMGDIVKTKAYLGNAGFTVLCADKKEEEAVRAFNEKFQIENIRRQLWFYAFTNENVALVCKKTGSRVEHVLAPDPTYLHVVPKMEKIDDQYMTEFDDGIPQKETYFKPDMSIVNQFNKLNSQQRKHNLSTSLTTTQNDWQRWNEKKLGKIEHRTYNGFTDRTVEPRMEQIFPAMALRRMVHDGNMAVYHHLKRMIWLIKIGAIKGGDKKNFWVRSVTALTKPEADKWLDIYKQIDRAMMAVVGADHEHEFVAPPIEYLKLENFQSVDNPIIRWSDIGPLLGGYSGKSQKYAGDYIALKKAAVAINQWRDIIGELLIWLYRYALGVKGGISILWNEFVLLEPKALLDRVKYCEAEVGLSPQTALQALGFNPDMEVRRLAEAHENPTRYFPIFESKQGLLATYYAVKHGWPMRGRGKKTKPQGKPPTGGPQSDNNGKGQQPRPSQAESVTEDTMTIINRLVTEGELAVFKPVTAPYETDDYYHVETTKSHTWAEDPEWVSKKLKNGIVMRLAKTADGEYAVKIWLLPKDDFDSLEEAEQWVKEHEN